MTNEVTKEEIGPPEPEWQEADCPTCHDHYDRTESMVICAAVFGFIIGVLACLAILMVTSEIPGIHINPGVVKYMEGTFE